jgi:hypothetical protein
MPGDRVVYLTKKGCYSLREEAHWRLVAVLRVAHRFENHAKAAQWYQSQGLPLPSNCLVPSNAPQPLGFTHARIPKELRPLRQRLSDDKVIRLWDAGYLQRARDVPVLLACTPKYLALNDPPAISTAQMVSIFGRVPGTQNPPRITRSQYLRLRRAVAAHSRSG